MAKQENAVMYAVEQVCGLYRVELLRMQSRVLTVPGAAGKNRPMFFGAWTDMGGEKHFSGMADFLARPRVELRAHHDSLTEEVCVLLGNKRLSKEPPHEKTLDPKMIVKANPTPDGRVTLLLWIETKAGKEKLSADQEAFRYYVQQNGEYYVSVKENFDELIGWFQAHGLREGGR